MGAVFLAFTFFVWAVAALLTGIYESTQVADSAFNSILQFNLLNFKEVSFLGLATLPIPIPNISYFGDLIAVASLDGSLWSGWAAILRWFLLAFTFGLFLRLLLVLFGALTGKST